MLEQLKESIKSGLVPDYEAGIFIKENYGALVGFCPENCITIEDVLGYTQVDFKRKNAGKPTIKGKIREFINGDNLPFNEYFGYKKFVDEGYDLVIGTGCVVHGQKWPKAVYCRNYEEILSNLNEKSKGKNR